MSRIAQRSNFFDGIQTTKFRCLRNRDNTGLHMMNIAQSASKCCDVFGPQLSIGNINILQLRPKKLLRCTSFINIDMCPTRTLARAMASM